MNAELYKLTFPSGKIYVGFTTKGVKKRVQGHRAVAASGKKHPLYAAWRMHGDPIVEVICIGSYEYILDLERKAIDSFGCMHPNGYNLMPGGVAAPMLVGSIRERSKGWKMDRAIVERLAAARRGTRLYGEALKNVQAAMARRRGIPRPDDVKIRISDAQKGRKLSKEHKDKLAESRKFQVFTDSHREKISNAMKGSKHSRRKRKAIVDGKEFTSVKEAFIFLGLPLEKHVAFRSSMADSMNGIFVHDGKEYHFALEFR